MIDQLLTISRNTFLESIRQPIFVVLLFGANLMLLFNPSLSAYTLDDDNKMLVYMGLSTLFLAGLFLAAFTATGVLNVEVENKTVLTVISKPVSRPLFVIGKFLGVAVALTLAYWILSVMFLLTVRHGVMQTATDQFDGPVVTFTLLAWILAIGGSALGNYLYNWVFNSSFVVSLAGWLSLAYSLTLVIDRQWGFQSIAAEFTKPGLMHNGQLIIVMVAIFQAVLIITALAIAVSTRLGQLMTLLICIGVFLLGLAGDIILRPAAEQASLANVTSFTSLLGWFIPLALYWLLPNLHFLWLADALPRGNTITLNHLLSLSVYSLLFIIGLLGLAISLFQTREVG